MSREKLKSFLQAIAAGFAVTAFFGIAFLDRTAIGTLEATCQNPPAMIWIQAFQGETQLASIEKENSSREATFEVSEIYKSNLANRFQINCILDSVVFHSSMGEQHLPIEIRGDNGFFQIDSSEVSLSSPWYWCFGFVLSWFLFSALAMVIGQVLAKRSYFENGILAAYVVLLGTINTLYSPVLLNSFNSFSIAVGTFKNRMVFYEGGFYNLTINSLLNFVPWFRYLSILSSGIVLLLLLVLHSLFENSRKFQVFLIFVVFGMFLVSPITAGYTQFIERATISCWIFLIFVSLLLRHISKSSSLRPDRGIEVSAFFVVLLLSLFRIEYLIIAGGIFFAFFRTSWKRSLFFFCMLLLVVFGTNKWIETTHDSSYNSNWKSRYVAISLFEYLRDSIQNSKWSQQKLNLVSEIYDLTSLRNPNSQWFESFRKDAKYEPENVLKIAKNVFRKALSRPFSIFLLRIRIGLSCLTEGTWKLSAVTKKNISNSKDYFLAQINGFAHGDSNKVSKSYYIKLVENDELNLYALLVLLILPFFYFKRHILPCLGILMLGWKFLVTSFLIPSRQLAYMFDVYFFPAILLLLFLQSLYGKKKVKD